MKNIVFIPNINLGDGRSNPFNTGRNDFTNGSSDNLKSQKQLEREAIRNTNKTSRYYNISSTIFKFNYCRTKF